MFFGLIDKQRSLNKKLIKAAKNGQLDQIKKLVAQGAEVNAVTNTTALLNAADGGHVDCLKYLLSLNADINQRNTGGCTALMTAASRGHLDCVKILLAADADISLTGAGYLSAGGKARNGKTAYEWAVLGGHGNTEVAKILWHAMNKEEAKIERQLKALRKKESVDEIIFERQVAGRLLQDVFNFTTLERISLIRKDADSAVEAMTCTGFSALEDRSQLRNAFDEHVRRGGKTPEERVFPRDLSKIVMKG